MLRQPFANPSGFDLDPADNRVLTPLLVLLVAGAALATAPSLWAGGRWYLALVLLAAGLLWATAPWHGLTHIVNTCFLLFVIGSAINIGSGSALIGPLSAVTLSLAAWDITHFATRLRKRAGEHALLIQSHCTRLLLTSLVGWSIGLLISRWRFSLNFGGSLAIALLAVIFLTRAVRRSRQAWLSRDA